MHPITAIKGYDALGRLILQQNISTRNLDISSLEKGLLFIHIETEEGVFVKKVIKE